MSRQATVLAALRTDPLYHDGRLKPGGERELRTTMDFWKAQGLKARVVMLRGGEHPKDFRNLWAELRLNRDEDFLLLCNGRSWEAKGWGLAPEQLSSILKASQGELRTYWARGLSAVLDRAGAQKTGRGRPESEVEEAAHDGSSLALGLGIGGLALSGGLGWVISRRGKLQRQRREQVTSVVERVRRRFAEVMLEAEALEPSQGRELQERAIRIDEDLDRLEKAHEQPTDAEVHLAIAQAERLESDLASLNSQLIQYRHQEREMK